MEYFFYSSVALGFVTLGLAMIIWSKSKIWSVSQLIGGLLPLVATSSFFQTWSLPLVFELMTFYGSAVILIGGSLVVFLKKTMPLQAVISFWILSAAAILLSSTNAILVFLLSDIH